MFLKSVELRNLINELQSKASDFDNFTDAGTAIMNVLDNAITELENVLRDYYQEEL